MRRTIYVPPLFAAAVALSVITLASEEAEAFCRGLTQAGPDPAVTHACFEGGAGVHQLYWKNRCVGYSLQSQASRQISLAQATPVVAKAFAAWSSASCGNGAPSIAAVDEGPVHCSAVQYEKTGGNQHVIVFRDDAWPHDDPDNTLALTTITYDDNTGEVFDADMEINTHDHTIVADGAPTPPAYDLLSIVTHEAGHFLGLAHSTDMGAVMFTFYRPGSTELTSDDMAGICSIDPPDGTRSTSAGPVVADACDPTPRHGFSVTCDGTLADGGPEAGSDLAGGGGGGGCTLGATSRGSGIASWLGLVSAALAGLVRRRRRGAGRGRAFALAAFVVLGAAWPGIECEAQASVSLVVTFEDLVRDSQGAAVITARERRSAWEGGRIVTYTRAHVETHVAGELPDDVWIRTLGGVVEGVGQVVEGEASFDPAQVSLVFLRPTKAASAGGAFVVTARGQGQYRVVREVGSDRLSWPGGGGILASGRAGRLAREVLDRRGLVDAEQEITRIWREMHDGSSGTRRP